VATLNLGILVSGSGTNLQAIIDAIAAKTLTAEIRVVISNRNDAFALERAARAGVPTRVLPHRDHANRETYDRALVSTLKHAGAEWIVLAGFMRILTREFLVPFAGRIINIHPALLPAFPGTHAQKQSLEYGVKVSGCTVHFVDEGVDTGPIINQRAVAVLDGDDEAALSLRILEQEHAALVEVLQWIAADRVRIEQNPSGGRSRVRVRRE
jgi:phosphoribosylglycinamide formyltransferase-1